MGDATPALLLVILALILGAIGFFLVEPVPKRATVRDRAADAGRPRIGGSGRDRRIRGSGHDGGAVGGRGPG